MKALFMCSDSNSNVRGNNIYDKYISDVCQNGVKYNYLFYLLFDESHIHLVALRITCIQPVDGNRWDQHFYGSHLLYDNQFKNFDDIFLDRVKFYEITEADYISVDYPKHDYIRVLEALTSTLGETVSIKPIDNN